MRKDARIWSPNGGEDEVPQEAINALLVEDDPLFSKLMAAILLTRRGSVGTASSAEEAIEILGSQRFDVLIADLGMKGLGGLGLIRWLIEERFQTSRILVITGEAGNNADCAWLKSQNVVILQKPFRLKALLEAVDSIVLAHP